MKNEINIHHHFDGRVCSNYYLPEPTNLFTISLVMSVYCASLPVININLLHTTQHQLKQSNVFSQNSTLSPNVGGFSKQIFISFKKIMSLITSSLKFILNMYDNFCMALPENLIFFFPIDFSFSLS